MSKEKRYTIYGGVNGAGKSTLFQLQPVYKEESEARINPDEIVTTFGDWKNEKDQMKAARFAVTKMKEYFEEGVSFNQETTMAGKTIVKNIVKAKELGYKVVLYYVGLESAELALERVQSRVKKGGHDISSDLVLKRYSQSLSNLKRIIPICDEIILYDNTSFLKMEALIRNNTLLDYAKDDKIRWLETVLTETKLLNPELKMEEHVSKNQSVKTKKSR